MTKTIEAIWQLLQQHQGETFHTASGTTEGCVARVPSIRFGAFELRNPRVAVMPGMDGQALLGMDVLRHFSLVQEGGRLRVQRDLAWELINAIPGVSCVKPQGALYMFPRLDPAVYPIQDDQEFFLEVLQETKVMLVQGTGFNWPAPDHFRIVFLPHEDDLRDAIGRVARFLEQYRKRKQTTAVAVAA